MKNLGKMASLVPTLVAVALAVLVTRHLWDYYHNAPWTRDAYVQANVVQVAPDVSGLVTEVLVDDNAPVHAGDVLFIIDRSRYRLALQQAQASVEQQQAVLSQLQREVARNRHLGDLVPEEAAEETRAKLANAQASLAAAQLAVEVAELDLQRTAVRSPASGVVNDRTARVGGYVKAGQPVLSVVDTSTLRVDGYFEETKLARIHIGQPVQIRLMGDAHVLSGHVQSIAAGIEDRNREAGSSLLPNVNPAFNWVRLAQRIPVRIAIDEIPQGVRLIVGRTATVSALEPDDEPRAAASAGTAPDAS